MIFSRVDLPAPFSPISASTSPARAASPTPSNAWTGPNRLSMPSISRTGSLIAPAPRARELTARPHHGLPVLRGDDGRRRDSLGRQRLVFADRLHQHAHRGTADVPPADVQRRLVATRRARLP